MAKVILPNDTLANTKRLGKRLLLKNRREGDTITLQALTRKMVFFRPQHDDKIGAELIKRWEELPPEYKEEWEFLGQGVYMDGKTLFFQEEKKAMTQGFYGVAVYGATRYQGIIKTKRSTIYGEAIYGVDVYTAK